MIIKNKTIYLSLSIKDGKIISIRPCEIEQSIKEIAINGGGDTPGFYITYPSKAHGPNTKFKINIIQFGMAPHGPRVKYLIGHYDNDEYSEFKIDNDTDLIVNISAPSNISITVGEDHVKAAVSFLTAKNKEIADYYNKKIDLPDLYKVADEFSSLPKKKKEEYMKIGFEELYEKL